MKYPIENLFGCYPNKENTTTVYEFIVVKNNEIKIRSLYSRNIYPVKKSVLLSNDFELYYLNDKIISQFQVRDGIRSNYLKSLEENHEGVIKLTNKDILESLFEINHNVLNNVFIISPSPALSGVSIYKLSKNKSTVELTSLKTNNNYEVRLSQLKNFKIFVVDVMHLSEIITPRCENDVEKILSVLTDENKSTEYTLEKLINLLFPNKEKFEDVKINATEPENSGREKNRKSKIASRAGANQCSTILSAVEKRLGKYKPSNFKPKSCNPTGLYKALQFNRRKRSYLGSD